METTRTEERVTSADGTTIVQERFGDGPGVPVIVVGGAICDRARTRPVAEALGRHLPVINYDRRGRGDSGDHQPYAIAREVDDLRALIAEAGGRASIYGHSSGAGLVLAAAATSDLALHRVVLHDAPYQVHDEQDSRIYAEQLEELLARGRRSDALVLFMTKTGMPPEMIDGVRQSPSWAGLEALAPTLAYDSEVMGDRSRGGAVPLRMAEDVTVPALVLVGGASPGFMLDVGRRLSRALPTAELEVLDGQDHVVAPEVLAPALARFLAA